MSSEIIPTTEYARFLEEKYKGLKVPVYKLRKWFFANEKVFFDCESSDKKLCLREIMAKPDYSVFIIYVVIKDITTNTYSFLDINFRNLGGKETLGHFMNRYHQQLETMTRVSLQGAGREYVDCIGHGYEEKPL